jgi:hypothetical protein
MGLITHIVIYLTVTKPVREAKARLWAVAPLMMMMMRMSSEKLLPSVCVTVFSYGPAQILFAVRCLIGLVICHVNFM